MNWLEKIINAQKEEVNKTIEIITEEAIRFNGGNTFVDPFTMSDVNAVRVLSPSDWFMDLVGHDGSPKSYDFSKFWNHKLSNEIYFAIDFIAKTVAKLDLDFYVNLDTNKREGNSWEKYGLNKRPNSYQNGFDLKYQIIFNMFYSGAAYVRPVSELDIDGNTRYSFYVLSNTRIVRVSDMFDNSYYIYAGANHIKNYNSNLLSLEELMDKEDSLIYYPEDLLIFKLNPSGISPLDWLWKDLHFISKLKDGLLYNASIAGSTKGVMFSAQANKGTQQQKKENKILDDFMRSGESGVITLGSVNERFQVWQEKADFSSAPQLTSALKKINEKLGVMDGLVGGESHQGKSELIELFYDNTLSPILKNLELEITNKLFIDSDVMKGRGVRFSTDELFKTNEGNLTKILETQMKNVFIDPNEARRRLGYELRSDEDNQRFIKLFHKVGDEFTPKQINNKNINKPIDNNSHSEDESNTDTTSDTANDSKE